MARVRCVLLLSLCLLAALPAQGIKALRRLDGAAVQRDLAWLRDRIEKRYSYRTLTGYDYAAAFDAAATRLSEGCSGQDLATELLELLAPFGDGHLVLRNEDALLGQGFLPCRLKALGGRVVALGGLRRRVKSTKTHPYLAAIDGVPVEQWLTDVRPTVAAGSETLIRESSLRRLESIAWASRATGRARARRIKLTLEDEKGSRVVVEHVVSGTRVRKWRRGNLQPRRHDGGIGYLPINQMGRGPRFSRALHWMMKELRDTKGLILDLRGNAGGSREPLQDLLPYFLDPGAPPHVATVAAYRIDEGEVPDKAEGYLAGRYLYPRAWPGWSKEQAKAIDRIKARFRPDWTLPEGEFSDWHYMVLEPSKETAFHYPHPLVILMDGDCFSSTDVFLGAFKGLPRVTLMGTPSAGGSGAPVDVTLPESGFRVRLCSIASFRPSGQRYEGKGILPDVHIEPTLRDLTGGTDSLLEAALRRLRAPK